MSLNIKPLTCNANCPSCYEREIRKYRKEILDFPAMKKTLIREIGNGGTGSTIHGGEPLLLGKKRVSEFLKIIFENRGGSGIQTNGTLLDDEWIEIFKKYKTTVGVSLDGPTQKMNAGRKTEVKKILEYLKVMRVAGINTSVISVLRKHNASPNRLPAFIKFLIDLEREYGIPYIRTNPGIGFSPTDIRYEQLSVSELADALCTITDVCISSKKYLWQPSRDIIEMMMGYKHATCTFNGCDVWATSAETPILSDGSLGCCMKGGGSRDGIAYIRAEKSSNARSEALFQIPMEKGGCADCEYWEFCHGGCPGEAENCDYRNKTRFCFAYRKLFKHVKGKIEGLFPSVDVESSNPSINFSSSGTTWRKEAMKYPEPRKNVSPSIAKNCHGDSHGDEPHGDSDDPSWRISHPEWGKK